MIEGPQPAAAASTAQLEEVGGPELHLLLVIIMTTYSLRSSPWNLWESAPKSEFNLEFDSRADIEENRTDLSTIIMMVKQGTGKTTTMCLIHNKRQRQKEQKIIIDSHS